MTDLERELAEALEAFVYAPWIQVGDEPARRLAPTDEVYDRGAALLDRLDKAWL